MLIPAIGQLLEAAVQLTYAHEQGAKHAREGDHAMDLNHLAGLMGDAEKEQLRDELHRLEEGYRQSTSAEALESLRTTAEQGMHQLRFFVDLMQGYQLIVQLAERNLRKQAQKPPAQDRQDGGT
jgi:hypothetical protein